MFGKAYRWVAEMEEIAHFTGGDPASREMYEAIAALYRQLAADNRRREGRYRGAGDVLRKVDEKITFRGPLSGLCGHGGHCGYARNRRL